MSFNQDVRGNTIGSSSNPLNINEYLKPSREIFAAGVPLDSFGENEWYYIDTSTSIQYYKQNGVWAPQVNWSSITQVVNPIIDVLQVDTIEGNHTEDVQIDQQTAGILNIGPTGALTQTQIQADGTITTQSATASIGVLDLAGEQMIMGPSYLIKAGANPFIINAASQGLSLQANTTMDILCGTLMNVSAPSGLNVATFGSGTFFNDGGGTILQVLPDSITLNGIADLGINSDNNLNVNATGTLTLTSGLGNQIILSSGGGAVVDAGTNLVTTNIFSADVSGFDITTTVGPITESSATSLSLTGATSASLTASASNLSLTATVSDIVLNAGGTITVTAGEFRQIAGSAGVPPYSFTSDTNTGIYSAGSDILGFSAGGSGRITISSSVIGPVANNTMDLGTAGLAIKDSFFVNAPTITSDKRLKKDIEPLPLGLEFINSLNPVKYKLICQDGEELHCGFVAQEVEESLIKMGCYKGEFGVVSHVDDIYGLKYDELVSCLVKCVQQLSERVKALEA